MPGNGADKMSKKIQRIREGTHPIYLENILFDKDLYTGYSPFAHSCLPTGRLVPKYRDSEVFAYQRKKPLKENILCISFPCRKTNVRSLIIY